MKNRAYIFNKRYILSVTVFRNTRLLSYIRISNILFFVKLIKLHVYTGNKRMHFSFDDARNALTFKHG